MINPKIPWDIIPPLKDPSGVLLDMGSRRSGFVVALVMLERFAARSGFFRLDWIPYPTQSRLMADRTIPLAYIFPHT